MIELRYDIEPRDWVRFTGAVPAAIDRWAEIPGRLMEDQYGYYYDVIITGNAKADVKPHRVLRPATLHLAASKILQEPGQYAHGFMINSIELWKLVTLPKGQFLKSTLSAETLDLMVQVAWFRGEVLFP